MASKQQGKIGATSWRFWLTVGTVASSFVSQRIEQFAGEQKKWRRASTALKFTSAGLAGASAFVGLADRLKAVGWRRKEEELVTQGYRERIKKGVRGPVKAMKSAGAEVIREDYRDRIKGGMRMPVRAVKSAGAELAEASEAAAGYAGAAASRAAAAVKPVVGEVTERLEEVPERLEEAASTTARGAGGAMRTLAWLMILGGIIFVVYEPDAKRRQRILSQSWHVVKGVWTVTRRHS